MSLNPNAKPFVPSFVFKNSVSVNFFPPNGNGSYVQHFPFNYNNLNCSQIQNISTPAQGNFLCNPGSSSFVAPSATTNNDNAVFNNTTAGNKKHFIKKFPFPIAILVLGVRGSGKTTQCELLAQHFNLIHISGGAIIKEKKCPFEVLSEIIKSNFGGNQPYKYNGVVLDRFIGKHEYDAYYIDFILQKYGIRVNLVFSLIISDAEADLRAEERNDNKVRSSARRSLEFQIQYAAITEIYKPIKIFRSIDCNKMPIENVQRSLIYEIENFFFYNSPYIPPKLIPPNFLKRENARPEIKLVVDYCQFEFVRKEMLKAFFGRKEDLIPIFPGSHISGILDNRKINENLRSRFAILDNYITLKADGQRLLLVRQRNTKKIFGFNTQFNFMFDFTEYFSYFDVRLPSFMDISTFNIKSSTMASDYDIDFIFDCEYISSDIPQIGVFDFLYLFGAKARLINFDVRLALLQKFIDLVEPNTDKKKSFFLKKYVKANEFNVLLQDYKNPSFPIDGIIFQHNSTYKQGMDFNILKWKPVENCTADFRLSNGLQEEDGNWSFIPLVSQKDEDETIWPNAVIKIKKKDVDNLLLSDGVIVECIKRGKNEKTGITTWDFVRERREKPTPNRDKIVKVIDEIDHISLEDLAKFLTRT